MNNDYYDKATDGYKGTDAAYKPENVEYAQGSGTFQKKPTFGQRLKTHYKNFWWVHLVLFVACTLVITLCIIYVGFPNIAQSQLNDAKLSVVSQDVTNPTPNSINLNMISQIESDSMYTPTIDAFQAALFLESSEPDIKPFGYITVPSQHASKKYIVTVNQPMQIADMKQFTIYNMMVLGTETYRVAMRGKADLHLGGLPTTSVNFNKVLTMKGLNHLKGMQVKDIQIKIPADADGSNMVGTVFIPNPSSMSIFMGNVTMNLKVDGKFIGTSTMNNMYLRPGDNNIPMRSTTNQTAVIELIDSKYKNAILPIEIVGNRSEANGQILPYFTAALQAAPIAISLNVGPALKAIGLNLGGY